MIVLDTLNDFDIVYIFVFLFFSLIKIIFKLNSKVIASVTKSDRRIKRYD